MMPVYCFGLSDLYNRGFYFGFSFIAGSEGLYYRFVSGFRFDYSFFFSRENLQKALIV
jgi:hypothetical protein